MIENTNTKQFYPGPILNNTLEITDFLFNDAEQIKIKHSKLNEEGILIDVDLNYPTDYEVTKVLPSDINAAEAALTASTGQIMLKNVNVLAGEKLTAYRVSPIIQDKDYPRTGAFPAATHEGALDYLTMQNQEQKDEIDRALKVPISTQNFEGSLPLPIPSRALKINNDGTGFEMSEFDPDLALELTEDFKNQAQQAAIESLASQTAAAASEQVATQQAQNATTQAANAKASADNAAELNQQLTTNYNTYNTNLINIKNDGISALSNASNALRQTQITNCLLEVPQNIKLELNNGTLTLKAGSKVIVPNGFEANGTTPKFDEIVTTKDLVPRVPTSPSETGEYVMVYDLGRNDFWANNLISNCTSGATAPTTGSSYFYNTSTNILTFYSKGIPEERLYSLPLGIVRYNSDNTIASFETFNGMGYIGSTVWVDKGVKGLIPNGRNKDGSLNNVEWTNDVLRVRTYASVNKSAVVSLRHPQDLYYNDFPLSITLTSAISQDEYMPSGSASYLPKENIWRAHQNSDYYNMLWMPIGSFQTDASGVISDLQPKLPVHLVDRNEFEEVHCVVKFYKNGYNWYRIWSDGFKEQGGFSGGDSNRTVNFLTNFTNTEYTVVLTPQAATRASTCTAQIFPENKTISSMSVSTWSANGAGGGLFWEARGY